MIPLTCRSRYSLLRATASVTGLCRRARRLGYPALGLTDTNNLHGLWPFLAACRREGLVPIIGAELACDRGRAFCLVRDPAGYRNLCRLLTARHTGEFSLCRLDGDRCRGLILLLDDPRLLARLHGQGVQVAAALVGRPCRRASELRTLAGRLGVMAVALPDVFFADPADHRLHRLQRAMATGTTLSRLPAGEAAGPGSFLDAPAAYAKRFAVWPETIANTRRIAEMCTFRGPEFGTVLPPYRNLSPARADARLRRAALAGARNRYGVPLPLPVTRRLDHELAIIAERGFSSYFLVVRDIVAPVSRTCGRGSAAASLVAYCLGITNVCPLRHNLYFERFLNPGRSDPPDIDVDFAWDERDRVLAGVLEHYGGHAAMVCTLVRLQPRMAIRETARVFGLPESEIRRVTGRAGGLRLHGAGPDPRWCGPDPGGPWPEILRLAAAITGMPRHVSVHSGGVVITPAPVADLVPVQRSARGVPLIQWDKDGAEAAGLVKIDLLGNRSLGVIRDTLQQVRRSGIRFDGNNWSPEEDAATRRTVAAGATMGCFYIESPAMRLLQKKAGRGDFEHLVIHSSIIRPAANDLIREYLRRLHGGAWQPLHPLLAEVLAETLGIMVYQEDVARVAVRFGFSHDEADRLRKIMARKTRQETLADYRQRFSDLARARGVDRETVEKIWEMMRSFEGYSFCKAHSASYAMVSFQAAWLKTHFPAEFMAAVLSNRGGYYSTFAYVSEARRLGLAILPPDVNRAEVHWQGRGKRLRVGLMAVRHLEAATMARIVGQRRRSPFVSVRDFLDRVRPRAREARSLIHAGGLDSLAGKGRARRAALLWQLLCWHRSGRIGAGASPAPPALPPDDPAELLRNEYRSLGFLCRRHPITLVDRRRLPRATLRADELAAQVGRRVRFLGWPVCGKVVATARGEAMEFFTFEDETGQVECTFFPRVHRRCRHLLHGGRPLLLVGTVEEEFGAFTLTVQEARPVGR